MTARQFFKCIVIASYRSHKGNQSATRKTGYMEDDGLFLIKEINNIMGTKGKEKKKLFTFDSHYTAFSACENAVEMTVENPIPWGWRKRWSIFFLMFEGNYFVFSVFPA